MITECYKLEIYVPETHAEAVKKAIFDAGAGQIGNYDSCCWQTSGVGQFRPLAGSNPFLGTAGVAEKVDEIKLELICRSDLISTVIGALKQAHPYETPAFQYWPIKMD